MSLRHPRRIPAIAIVACVLVVASCGDDDDTTASTPTTDVGGSASTASSGPGASNSGEAETTAAPAGEATPGVTADSITIGVISGTSGPFAEPIKEAQEGLNIWVAETNAAGGINGRQIEIKQYDHGETVDGGVAACKSVLSDNDVFFTFEIQGQDAHLTAANCLDEAGFTSLIWQMGDEFEGKWSHTFGVFAGNRRAGEVTASYIAANVTPDDKVAFAIGNGAIFKAAGDPMKAEAEALGVNVVDTQYVELTGTTFVPQLQHMKDAGATVVALSTVGIEATLLKEAKTIGFSPRWMGTGYTYDFLPAGAPGVYDGVTGLSLSKPIDTPEFAEFAAVADQYTTNPCEICAQQFLFYGQGRVVGAVIEGAGPDPTRASLEEGLHSISGFDNGVFAPVTWGATDFVGTDAMFPVKCCSADNAWQTDGEAASEF